ncbi:HDIG domain-containing protein [Aureisphaera galaxeae]|uniref:HD family phosphohydrolase n=1 Tax=Aureisphaera galaxeae TaxID=1538023 RepID=UPI00234FC678|nr:HDIG domain-containing metalloprotein [Aureisphaera galaxeae]MDC8004137.1 HDIG domain-containing protein [Aureisphaera galaxeae]
MATFFSFFTKNQSLIYKVFLYLISTVLVIYLLPKGGKFKYDFQKGKPWQDENLYAPFNFTIKKDKATLEQQEEDIRASAIPYFDHNSSISDEAAQNFVALFESNFVDSLYRTPKRVAQNLGVSILNSCYTVGVIDEVNAFNSDKLIYLKSGNEVREILYSQLFQKEKLSQTISTRVQLINAKDIEGLLQQLLTRSLVPNVSYNARLTNTSIESDINNINPNRGIIEKGERIIAKGEMVEGDKFQILNSLQARYESDVWSQKNYYWVVLGYSILVSLVFIMLFLFLNKYRRAIFRDNTKVSFIFFNVIFMVFATTMVVKYDATYIYVIPLCILPIVLKSFFDARLGLFVHVLTLLLLGFIVPHSFEFLFLQIIAGIVTILTVSELSKRANLFISVGQITLIYIIGYFAFFIIQEGNIETIEWKNFAYFILCGLITLFAFPLIYIYEKVFGLVSEVSLLELSNTNSKLLKELSNKAPGTFHHSLNVANLSEAAANEIGADAMLVRVGALYHDVGKLVNASHFTENQLNSVNVLNELAPRESAKIIIDHVIRGIEIARKYKLPDRVIDFIRTHHGTSLVYYFYKKEEELNGEAMESDFRYPGPKPFSKETAILMMADSVEAASKSLKEPTSTKIDAFVENIINKQMEQGQFINANITFKEIETIKKVLKKKLYNIYHLRVEYPE